MRASGLSLAILVASAALVAWLPPSLAVAGESAVRAAPTAKQAAEPVPPIREGSLYSGARGTLIAKGFQPVSSGGRDDARCSAGRQDVCNAYPETVSCSGTGAAECRFIFTSKGGTTVTVVADGADAGHLKVVTVRRSAKRDAEWQQRAAR